MTVGRRTPETGASLKAFLLGCGCSISIFLLWDLIEFTKVRVDGRVVQNYSTSRASSPRNLRLIVPPPQTASGDCIHVHVGTVRGAIPLCCALYQILPPAYLYFAVVAAMSVDGASVKLLRC